MPADRSARLPRNVAPRRYELELATDLDAGSFTGTVTIDVEVSEPTAEIRLNAVGLSVGHAGVVGGAPAAATPEPASEQLVLRWPSPLAAGPHRLELSFSGSLEDGLRGYYRSSFTGPDGATRSLAGTQFESTDARRAFPCFDEPDRKAAFSVTLVVPEGMAAVSCSPVESDEPLGDGRRRVRFADTMPMSTYVLAWVVGPLERAAAGEVDGVPVAVMAPPGRSGLAGFGLDAAVHALRWLAGWFELPYPGAKLDHVAIPDFAFGAMENFGCVTYRETALLVDRDTASQSELLRVATVVAHETAHMWFGDLVTMRWWNGIWLNEAFATFMEAKTVEALEPAWDVWATQLPAKAGALAVDALHATRPVEYEVGSPEDADAMFDSLTYAKGCAVLRMMEQYLGEETFRRGICAYLARHRWANTEAADLWDALEQVSGQPVRATMDSWILQAGHPLVVAERGDDPAVVRLSQRRFVHRGEAPGRWSVPVVLRASAGGVVDTRRVLLGDPTEVSFAASVDWVVVNGGGWGFYRSATDPGLAPPADAVRRDCTNLERFHLVSDGWAAVTAGLADPATWLTLVEHLGDETDPDVWAAVAGPLGVLDRLVTDEQRPALERLVARVAGPAMTRLGWDPHPGEPPRVAMARGRVVALLGTVGGDPAVREEAARRHRRRLEGDLTALAPDVLGAAVAVVARTGGADTWEELLATSEGASTPQDRIRYLLALAAVDDPDLAGRTLDLALTPRVRLQDADLLIGRVLAGRWGAEVAWPWLRERWAAVTGRFPPNLLLRMLEGLTGLSDRQVAADVHRWLADHPLPVGGARLAQLEELLDVNVELAERLAPRLGDLLGGRA